MTCSGTSRVTAPCPCCGHPLPAEPTRSRYRCRGCGANWTPAELRRGGKRDRTDPYQGRVAVVTEWRWRKRAATD